jgi:hypothetical protein
MPALGVLENKALYVAGAGAHDQGSGYLFALYIAVIGVFTVPMIQAFIYHLQIWDEGEGGGKLRYVTFFAGPFIGIAIIGVMTFLGVILS